MFTKEIGAYQSMIGEVTGRLGDLGYKSHRGYGPHVNSVSFIRDEETVLPLEVHWHIENAMFPYFEAFNIERMWQSALPVKLVVSEANLIEDHQVLSTPPPHRTCPEASLRQAPPPV